MGNFLKSVSAVFFMLMIIFSTGMIYFDSLLQKIVNKLEGWKSKFISFAGKIVLIKSVLSSIPIHTLSAVPVHKAILKKIEKLIKLFLWGQNGKARTQWCSWKTICLKKEEGGLGIRNIHDTVKGLHGKLAWRILERKSLWSSILSQKYKLQDMNNTTHNPSILWKLLLPHFHNLQSDSIWLIGKGEIDFWKDNWAGEPIAPDYHTPMQFKVACTRPNDLQAFINPDIMEKLKSISLNVNEDDILIYTQTNSGNFNIKSYIEKDRVQRSHLDWTEAVWHNNLPPKVSGFMWKVLKGAVPVDNMLMKRMIMGPYKCNCCDEGNLESIDHLLVHSDRAKEIWSHFGNIVGKPHFASNVDTLLKTWIHGNNIKSQGQITTLQIFASSIWEIWKSRCKARYEDIPMNSCSIIKKVEKNVQWLNLIANPKGESTKWEKKFLNRLRIPLKKVEERRGKWVRWNKPGPGKIKINVDGSYLNDEGTVGGIIRTEDGTPELVFWRKVHTSDPISTEITAITIAIDICDKNGYGNFEIESDSEQAVHIFQGKIKAPSLNYIARRYRDRDIRIGHVLREQNMVADLIAKFARDKEDNDNCPYNQLPLHVKHQIFQERIGLGAYRRRR
ncbi:hypothetical protein CASFOL_020490 [Castilleja foliolosa]|uniref:RNase H type-1 domain-containing protein n=1 Tax=Castilleja foliolosa TaxID=1961234 RepID=A0ABD3D1R5_9LAMI